MMWLCALLLAGGLLGACSAGAMFAHEALAQQSADARDRRVAESDESVPAALFEALQSVGFVDVELLRFQGASSSVRDGGTGVLVAPCLVLTAAHLFGPEFLGGSRETPERLRDLKVHFRVPAERATADEPEPDDTEAGENDPDASGDSDGQDRVQEMPKKSAVPASPIQFTKVIVPAAIEPLETNSSRRDPLLDDWVLLRLDQAVPLQPIRLADSDCCSFYRLPVKAAIGGYPADRIDRGNLVKWVDPACQLRLRLANSMFATNCQATSGNSGGPVLVRDRLGWGMAGIITRAPPPVPGKRISDNVSYAIGMGREIREAIAIASLQDCGSS